MSEPKWRTYVYYQLQCEMSQKRYEECVNQKELMFSKTQPHALTYEKDRIDGGEPINSFDAYLIEKEKSKIDSKIAEAWLIVEDRIRLLKESEEILRESTFLYDKVYRMHHLDAMNGYRISRKIHYTPRQIYRIISKIDAEIEKMSQNVTNKGVKC